MPSQPSRPSPVSGPRPDRQPDPPGQPGQPDRQPSPAPDFLSLEPVPTLLARTRAELSAEFDFARPMRVSRAPGRLDVMGGIADYTGSLVCEATLDRAAAVVLQERADRELQLFSFNLSNRLVVGRKSCWRIE